MKFSIQATLVKIMLFVFVASFFSCGSERGNKVLLFTKTKGYYHESIPEGIRAIEKLAESDSFSVKSTDDASEFTDDNLKNYRAVIFLNTTGNILNTDQQVALQRYIQAGGGFVGIHAAADAEYNWPWYNSLVGAYFLSHPGNPNVRKAVIHVSDSSFPAAKVLPKDWERTDEWYNYKNISSSINVIARLDEDSYEGGENGPDHPIAWYQEYDGGRSFYTGGGHTKESYAEPVFIKHLSEGIKYAMGDGQPLDYSKAYAVKAPEDNRFTKTILSDDLNEPMELAVASDGRVFFVERSGNFYMYDPQNNRTKLLRRFPVLPDTKEAFGNGLLGMTLDPNFDKNNQVYFFYTPDMKPAHQRISRFVIAGRDSLDISSEKVIISVPIDLEVSAHTGGSLAWDTKGNLFISTGDNTVPFESSGYAPIDIRPGRKVFDAQRSAGNTNDLRGKILRIHPEPDGSYTIPAGNLFAPGTPGTKPEIYTMGCRNPYRIAVDPATSVVYWGEIGPDAGRDGQQGPRGYDEINQAKKPGYYGWPYFVGDNKPYLEYDFATEKIGAPFNAQQVVNTSPLNTGSKNLPAAVPAMIWYPYDKSKEFPSVGTGGRSAMAGEVYHYQKSFDPKSVPSYYDGALFVFDWMRNWVYAVRLDSQQNFKRMEPFMATSGDFRRPIDLDIASNGIMYMLEYGSVYGIDNVDARLVKIEYNTGNRQPKGEISATDTAGLAPLKVKLEASKSVDPDEDDELTYEWTVEGEKPSGDKKQLEHTFSKNGLHKVVLTVKDPHGLSSSDTLTINVGNSLPQLVINKEGNQTFYFGNEKIRYSIGVKDAEDKAIDSSKMSVSVDYVPREAGMTTVGHQQPTAVVHPGKSLMNASDCKACHRVNEPSVGPSFLQVAERYDNDKDAVSKLADKIINGGAGVWGEHAMSAHPQISVSDASKIVQYILSLNKQKQFLNLPASGELPLETPTGKPGRYVLNASYTDKGGQGAPLTGTVALALRPARLQAEDADVVKNMHRGDEQLGSIHNKSYFVFRDIDLTGINSLRYRFSSKEIGAQIEVRLNSVKGPVISVFHYPATGSWDQYREAVTELKKTEGKNNLYFVFVKELPPNEHMCSLDWIEFVR